LNNQTGHYHFRVWRGGSGKLVGHQLSIFEYEAWRNAGWKISGFDGRRGNVVILFDDFTITRLDMLAFAIKFMEGQLVNVHIDLRTLTSTITPIIPPP
jgi:hypothetical protein